MEHYTLYFTRCYHALPTTLPVENRHSTKFNRWTTKHWNRRLLPCHKKTGNNASLFYEYFLFSSSTISSASTP